MSHDAPQTRIEHASQPSRRGFLEVATQIIGAALGLALLVPGVAFLLDPLRRKAEAGGFRALPVTLDELQVGVPRQVPIVEAAQDAWVTYPREPLGSVWLVRHADNAQPPVTVFTAECPHLGCAITLAADARSFYCPCHSSAFGLDGRRTNSIPPRGMDELEVEPVYDPKAAIRVRFQRFQTLNREKIPLV
jgi:menaquinol-cytochrome c reductase iron-sulfur subunit